MIWPESGLQPPPPNKKKVEGPLVYKCKLLVAGPPKPIKIIFVEHVVSQWSTTFLRGACNLDFVNMVMWSFRACNFFVGLQPRFYQYSYGHVIAILLFLFTPTLPLGTHAGGWLLLSLCRSVLCLPVGVHGSCPMISHPDGHFLWMEHVFKSFKMLTTMATKVPKWATNGLFCCQLWVKLAQRVVFHYV